MTTAAREPKPKKCRAQGCEQYFLPRGRSDKGNRGGGKPQKYCSVECKNKETQRQWRVRQRELAKARKVLEAAKGER